jgi:DNA-3-methyladenine glycosylase II
MAQIRKDRAKLQSNPRKSPPEGAVARSGGGKSRVSILPRIIATDDDLREGVRALRRKCAIMRQVHDMAGHPPLRLRPAGFEGLARIIVGQQLSVASATAIWTRTADACKPFEPGMLLSLEDTQLAAVGLSRSKIRTLRAIAEACGNGLNLAGLDRASEEEVHAALTEIVGIGPWTADVYIMFCLGRADGWAPGDLALQIAAQRAMSLDERPSAEMLREIGERWRPWRGVAARLLWAYYAATKQKASAVPV